MYGQLTNAARNEHRAYEKVIESLHTRSVQTGFKNRDVVRDIDKLVRRMAKEGVLPTDCYIGRLRFSGLSRLERVAIKCPLTYLEAEREKIHNWVEDNTDYNAEDVFNALRCGAVIATSQGLVPATSPVITELVKGVSDLKSGTKKMAAFRDVNALMGLAINTHYLPSTDDEEVGQ